MRTFNQFQAYPIVLIAVFDYIINIGLNQILQIYRHYFIIHASTRSCILLENHDLIENLAQFSTE